MELLTMSWLDYCIFITMLTLSAAIGLYHGVKRKKNNTVEDYLFGGRNIPAAPVILSNMASNISSIGQILIPVETYYFGGQIILESIGEYLGFLVMYFFFLPVYYHLEFVSLFEYLEMRFNKTARILGCAVFTITEILFALIIMYSACLAISKAIPVPFYVLSTVLCIFCTIYTSLGGLRGVVWTDFLQALLMWTSLIIIIVISTVNVGGVNKVIEIANNGGRLDLFNTNPSPFLRHSIWSIILSAGFFSVFKCCTSPGVVQRQLSISTYRASKNVALLSGAATSISSGLAAILGIVLYATYHNCDPVLSQAVSHSDQMVPYHIVKLANNIPGLPGIFLAGLLSAALSSLSTILNCLSGVIFEDCVKPLIPVKLNNAQSSLCMKIIVIALGLIISVGIFAIKPSATGYQLFRTLTNITAGFTVFLFSFGMFYRKANGKGAIIGAIAGIITSSWIGIGSQNAMTSGKIQYMTKVISAEGCSGNISQLLNVSTSGSSEYSSPVIFADDVPYLYRISFGLLMFVALTVSAIVGILVSLCTVNKKVVDESLLIPQIRKTVKNVTDENIYLRCEQNDVTNS